MQCRVLGAGEVGALRLEIAPHAPAQLARGDRIARRPEIDGGAAAFARRAGQRIVRRRAPGQASESDGAKIGRAEQPLIGDVEKAQPAGPDNGRRDDEKGEDASS